MSFGKKELFFNLDSQSSGLARNKNLQNLTADFFEGDTYTVRVHLRNETEDGSEDYQLKDKEKIALAFVETSDLSSTESVIIAYVDQFEGVLDEDGDVAYEGVLTFNTQEVLDALGTRSLVRCTVELVVLDELFGKQYSVQGIARIRRSAVAQPDVETIGKPNVNIGSYSTVVSLASGIVDNRILGLKDGAPAEFDTLFELANAAMRMFSNATKIGNFDDYLEGKALADAGLTVVSLGQMAVDASTFIVSHSPSRPRAVDARVAV